MTQSNTLRTPISALQKIALEASISAAKGLREAFLNRDALTISLKSDRSQVSEADLQSHKTICDLLEKTGIPVVSEESAHRPEKEDVYWLIDPLDGTDEFLSGSPDFCICIALIHDKKPVLGVLGWVMEDVHWVSDQPNSLVLEFDAHGTQLRTVSSAADSIRTILASRTRPDRSIDAVLAKTPEWKPVFKGSALKFIELISGNADVYPRNANLNGWDLAAGDALLRALGGGLFDAKTGDLVEYELEHLKVPFFAASASRKMAFDFMNRVKELQK